MTFLTQKFSIQINIIFHLQFGGHFRSFGSSVSTRVRTMPDGSVESVTTRKDSEGREETTVTRQGADGRTTETVTTR